LEVLPWGGTTINFPWTIDARLPGFSANGGSVGQIAAALDRALSTISRELKRNGGMRFVIPPYAPSASFSTTDMFPTVATSAECL
jgi:hypothetical protein